MLRKREHTKREIKELKKIGEDPLFRGELITLLEDFKQGDALKWYLTGIIENELPLHKATSVTWLVFEVCNAFNDWEIGKDYLSELVVDIEDLVEDIEKIIEKYKK